MLSHSPSSPKRWYAVQTQPRREALAQIHLCNQSFDTFWPTRRRTRRDGGKQEERAPLFPGYLFVSLNLERDRWRSINGTLGVMHLVAFGNGGRPSPVPVGFVERLQELGDAGSSRENGLRADDLVRVIGGPFDDLCGRLEAPSDQERVTILLSLLGNETRVSLRRGSLLAA